MYNKPCGITSSSCWIAGSDVVKPRRFEQLVIEALNIIADGEALLHEMSEPCDIACLGVLVHRLMT